MVGRLEVLKVLGLMVLKVLKVLGLRVGLEGLRELDFHCRERTFPACFQVDYIDKQQVGRSRMFERHILRSWIWER